MQSPSFPDVHIFTIIVVVFKIPPKRAAKNNLKNVKKCPFVQEAELSFLAK